MQRPFGLAFAADGTMRADPKEISIVREAQQLRDWGYTLEAIANELTLCGHRNRAGGRFSVTQIHRMLKRHAGASVFLNR